jgi:hypothetical protein
MKSSEKWPVIFEIRKLSESDILPNLNIYLIFCLANQEQIETAQEGLGKFQLIVSLDDGRLAASKVARYDHIQAAIIHFQGPSKTWRGQYQVIARALVKACDKALHGE